MLIYKKIKTNKHHLSNIELIERVGDSNWKR